MTFDGVRRARKGTASAQQNASTALCSAVKVVVVRNIYPASQSATQLGLLASARHKRPTDGPVDITLESSAAARPMAATTMASPQSQHSSAATATGSAQPVSGAAATEPERLPMPSRNPIPLSASQEAQVRDLFYARVRQKCAAEIKGEYLPALLRLLPIHLPPTVYSATPSIHRPFPVVAQQYHSTNPRMRPFSLFVAPCPAHWSSLSSLLPHAPSACTTGP